MKKLYFSFFLIILIVLSHNVSGQITLLKDINTIVDKPRLCNNLTALDSIVIFTAENDLYGNEIWRTNGTPEGTFMLKDVAEGLGHSYPKWLTVYKDKVYFGFSSISHQIYFTDGTLEGTKHMNPVNWGGFATEPVIFNNLLFYTSSQDDELWSSDGTDGGTQLIKDINPAARSYPKNFLEANGKLYFYADGGTNGKGLWETDGTTAGTKLFKKFDVEVKPKIFYDSHLYFTTNDQSTNTLSLWKSNCSDSSSTGTYTIIDSTTTYQWGDFKNFVEVNNTLVFTSDISTTSTKYTLRSDGTIPGTYVLNPETKDNSVFEYVVCNDEAYLYDYYDNSSKDGIYKTDGTLGGTIKIHSGSINYYLKVFNNELYFSSNSDLYKYDPIGDQVTQLLTACNLVKDLGVYNGKFYFNGGSFSNTGYELYETDGTPSGTKVVKDITPGTSGYQMAYGAVINSGVVFTYESNHNPYFSDGTESGTIDLTTEGTTISSNPDNFIKLGDHIYFTAQGVNEIGMEDGYLYKTDGTEANTIEIGRFGGTPPSDFTIFKNHLLFSYQHRTYITDGSDNGEIELIDHTPKFMGVLDSIMIMALYDTPNFGEIWKTNGTPEGTVLVKNINEVSGSSDMAYPVVYKGYVYFSATNGVDGLELWRTDGTPDGTTMVKDIESGPGNSSPQHLIVYNDTLYFFATITGKNRVLMKSDGTEEGTNMLIDNGAYNTSSQPLVVFKDKLFFNYYQPSSGGSELWITDGSEAGTKLFADLNEHILSSNPGDFKVSGGYLYFDAYTDDGRELWRTDGTREGTRMVKDIYPGPASFDPVELTDANGVLYFTSNSDEKYLWETFGGECTTQPFSSAPANAVHDVTNLAAFGDTVIYAVYDSIYGVEPYIYIHGKEPFSINTKPALTNVGCEPQQINLKASASGEYPITYAWFKDDILIADSVNNHLSFSDATTGHNGTYKCAVIHNICDTIFVSSEISLDPKPAVNIVMSDDSICPDEEVILTASNADSYIWNKSVENGVAFTPAQTDTFTVIGTNSFDCKDTASSIVVVNPKPNVNISFTDTALCKNETTTLSGQGAVSYNWNQGITDNVAFTPDTTKTYTVIGENIYNCIDSAKIKVSVYPIPEIAISFTDTVICSGHSVTLTASGANTYNWEQGNKNDTAFVPENTAFYVVTGTSIHDCSQTDSIKIRVKQSPEIVIDATTTAVCDGQPVTLTATGGDSLSWDGSIENGVEFFPSATAIYKVTAKNTNNCFDYDSVTISVSSDHPSAGFSTSENDLETQITDLSSNAVSYIYYFGDDSVAFVAEPVHSYQSAGSYTIWQVISNGCGADSISQLVTVTAPVGITANNETQLRIFPNPSTGMLYLDLSQLNDEVRSVGIYNQNGHKVTEYQSVRNELIINLSNYQPGVYIVRIDSGRKSSEYKIIKQ